ncbi:hypothetical protein HMPREF3023_07845 [Peptoniphilus sp. HMSC075B08]|uniref:hypothetical protein n=1 Tax=Peptoniphilus sp. HMSC075B08 TaxID=1739525 RepID=UPI0008A56F05|nr:hypothetical protein [Peptoniphilus sp. HMSC075B08]OFO62600.1 hypothetical protein HMPREF3023_07845 [Peptoniphilus sp. HMSC075B08]
MNKKLTSLSLAGVMLLSTASPVFAEVTEAVKDVKEPTKMEKVLEEGKEKVAKAEEAGKKTEEKAAEKMTEAKEKVEEKAETAKEEAKKDAKKVEKKAEEKVKEVKTIDVKATNQKVKLDGKDVVISGYNIDGYNYFKLRDLAAVLKDSQAKFGVDYKDGVVTLTKAVDYKVVESDQKPVKAESKGMLTNDKVLVGDKTLTATAYKIDDLNYYKLRDLGKELGFGVGYDEATKSVLLTSVVNEKEEVKEEKVAPKLEEVKEAINKELAKEKEVRASEEYKKATDEVKTNYENAIAAGKNIVADKDATLEQANNELKALVEAGEKIGLKAEAKIEEKAEKGKKEIKKDVKEGKEEVKETAKEVK